ncbi:MAG: hypothetical protein Q4E09_05365 [Eubacteriales bacterium]|nr:hypothetical protein [Eubacteriales bacterium]
MNNKIVKKILALITVAAINFLWISTLVEAEQGTGQLSTLKAQQELINAFSEESLETEFRAIVNNWLAEQDDYKGVEFELEFTKNPLLMDEQEGFKVYSNWDLALHLIYDWESLSDQEDGAIDAFCQKATNILTSHPLGRLLIHSVEVRCYDPDRISRAETNSGIIPVTQDYTQSDAELKLQAELLTFTDKLDAQVEKSTEPREIKEVCLSEFGPTEENNQLYALVTLYQSPVAEDLPSYLEEEGQTLWDSLQADPDLKAALDELDINSLKLEYRVRDVKELQEPLILEFK